MEIGKNKLNKNTKAIIYYCLCVILFFILNACKIVNYVDIFILNIFDFVKNFSQCFEIDPGFGFFLIFIAWLIYVYLTAKICGIFKKLDNLKIYISIPIIMFINIGFYYFVIGRTFGKYYIHLSPTEVIGTDFFWILPVYFLIYKFFGFLAKKFPFPFRKIGYYTSIEFPKDMYLKIKTYCSKKV